MTQTCQEIPVALCRLQESWSNIRSPGSSRVSEFSRKELHAVAQLTAPITLRDLSKLKKSGSCTHSQNSSAALKINYGTARGVVRIRI
jgi:hypothetical protein